MVFQLMFREYCSLCHQMRDALRPFQEEWGFQLEVIDVDEFPELEQKYNDLVPVLLHNDIEICHWHLDENKLLAYLSSLPK